MTGPRDGAVVRGNLRAVRVAVVRINLRAVSGTEVRGNSQTAADTCGMRVLLMMARAGPLGKGYGSS